MATFDCRGRPLEGLGMIRRPCFPVGQHRRPEPPGARMPRTSVLNRLERPCDLGLVVCTTRVGHVVLPGHPRQEPLVHPVLPARGRALCATSPCTVCHQKSTRAERPARCLETLSNVFFFAGTPCEAIKVSSAVTAACNRCSTFGAVGRVTSTRRQGWRVSERVARGVREGLRTSCQRCTSASCLSTSAWACGVWGRPGWDAWTLARRSRAGVKACWARRRRLTMASA
jgi:hypothetical protein